MRWVLGVVAALGVFGCDAPPVSPTPIPSPIPPFVYVADSAGYSNLVRWRNDTTTTLTTGASNYSPNSVGARIVFASDRVARPQIFIADLDLVTQHQVTTGSSFNSSPVLSPRGDSIAFVSTRSGTARVWLINAPALDAATFDTPAALATGSPDYIPEDAPAWNPMGGTIAFTSVSSGSSQVYVVASGGGVPSLVTNEIWGAFQPNWSSDGTTLYYVTPAPNWVLRRVSVNGLGTTTVVDDSLDVGGPASCNATVCLFGQDPAGEVGWISALPVSGAAVQQLFPRTAAKEREPAIVAH